jgi:hypothetical protein
MEYYLPNIMKKPQSKKWNGVRNKKCIQKYLSEIVKERTHFRLLKHTHRLLIKTDLLKIFQSAGWIHVAEDIVQWQAILNT